MSFKASKLCKLIFSLCPAINFILLISSSLLKRQSILYLPFCSCPPITPAFIMPDIFVLFKKSVEKRKGTRPWWILFRARQEEMFSSPKIVFRQTSDRIVAAVDQSNNYYAIDSVNIGVLKPAYNKSAKFFIGLLNSSLLNFFYREISQEQGRVLAQVKPQRLKMLPIVFGTDDVRNAIILRVNQIEKIISANSKEYNIVQLTEEIDEIVYQLYGLTGEEIAIVEGTK